MIKVEKDFEDIPKILTQVSRKEAFIANISSASYCDDKNRYKVGSVQKRLNKVYHLKCAYCEQKLLDAPRHIEHYRPKDTYYWLAYSWDNLLLCCGACNSAKGKRFAKENNQVIYINESFESIHFLGKLYDEIEKPKIINPEKENVLDLIFFDREGIMYSRDTRVHHTIEEACKLNRNELVELRIEIITDFINVMNEHYLFFQKAKDLTRFIPDINNFIEKCKIENEFYAFRYFIIKNIEIYVLDRVLQTLIKKLFVKLK